MARDAADDIGQAVIGMLFIGVLILVAVWYFSQKYGGIAQGLAQGSANIAGGLSNGLYNVGAPQFISNPVNNWLADFTSWAGQWFTGSNPMASPAGGANVAPQYYPDDTDVENAQ